MEVSRRPARCALKHNHSARWSGSFEARRRDKQFILPCETCLCESAGVFLLILPPYFLTVPSPLLPCGGGSSSSSPTETRKDWLGGFLSLPGGIPSHDTFNRVFSALDPLEWRTASGLGEGRGQTDAGEVVSIDGKAIRGRAKRAAKPSCTW